MKKLLAIIIAASSLTACNSGGSTSNENNSINTNKTNLTTNILKMQDPQNICSNINPNLPYHAEFCQSVQAYTNSLVQLVQSMIPNYSNYDVSVDINITEEQAVAPTKDNPDVDQTTQAYNQLSFNDDLGLYPTNSFPFNGEIITLGYNGGTFLSYLAQIQGVSYQAKNPMDYIINIANDPSMLNPLTTGIGLTIDGMGARAVDKILQYQRYQVNPYPLGNFQPAAFTVDQFNNFTPDQMYNKYWGVAAGGGSGAGFTISIDNPDNVVLAGGVGGGGGFSSPGSIQYESDNKTVSSLLQTAAGSSAGGGMQFVADNAFSQSYGFTDGLGFGGGAAYGDGHDDELPIGGGSPDQVSPLMTYYPNLTESPVTLPVNGRVGISPDAQQIQIAFAQNLAKFKTILKSKPSSRILIKGAGGMGVGAQLLYLGLVPGSTNEYRLQEYLPHAISSGASFVVSIQLTPKNQVKLTTPQVFNSAEQQFYNNLDKYYTEAIQQTMHKIDGNGGYLCTYYICKSNQKYIIDQAVAAFGSIDKIPSWLKIDTCNFNKDTDPNICPRPNSL